MRDSRINVGRKDGYEQHNEAPGSRAPCKGQKQATAPFRLELIRLAACRVLDVPGCFRFMSTIRKS